MNKEVKKGIIFDMDGTLWDSAESVAMSWNTIITKPEYGLEPLTKEDIMGIMGLTMDAIGERLFGTIEQPRRAEMMEVCYVVENDYLREHGGVLYPDLKETLKKLKEKYHLYIVSNCQSGYIEAFLEHYGFGYLFDDIECFGNNRKKKGDNIADVVARNQLEEAYYVGDIQGDYDATMEAGITFIHAAYGFGTISEPTLRIGSFAELTSLLKVI